jgi:hypothetical protein
MADVLLQRVCVRCRWRALRGLRSYFMKAGGSQVIVDTFVVACLGLAGAIIGLEHVLDGDEAAYSELTNGKDEVAGDAVRAHVRVTWRSAALSRVAQVPGGT